MILVLPVVFETEKQMEQQQQLQQRQVSPDPGLLPVWRHKFVYSSSTWVGQLMCHAGLGLAQALWVPEHCFRNIVFHRLCLPR